MTYSWEAIKEYVARKIAEALSTEILKIEVAAEDLGRPPEAKLGDLAFGCFKPAKMLGKSPADIAKDLQAKLGKGDHTIEGVAAAGPYLNVTLKTGDLVARIV